MLCVLLVLAIIFCVPKSEAATVYDFETGAPLDYYNTLVSNSKVKIDNLDIFIDNNNGACDSEAIGATTLFIDEESDYVQANICLYQGRLSKLIDRNTVFFREVGHVAGYKATKTQQKAFRKINDLHGPWRNSIYKSGIEEYFADAYAWCTYKPPKDWIKGNSKPTEVWHYWPSKNQFKRTCKKVFK